MLQQQSRQRTIQPGCQFSSDNTAGICPEALQGILEADQDYAPSYGEDHWTRDASNSLRDFFETDCQIFFVFNGTAANSLSIAASCLSYHSVICAAVAHVETDECGGPEFFSGGVKLLLAETKHGKMAPHSVQRLIEKRSDIHYPKPRLLSLTQSTEMGTVYSVEEVESLTSIAKSRSLKVHMDGARLTNAIAHLEVSPKEITWRAGVDVLCLGGTKNGLPLGDVVVCFDDALAKDFDYRCKQAGQLASKMRYLSSPWLGMLRSGTWLGNGRHANAMATRLSKKLAALPGIELICETQANAVFARMPEAVANELFRMGWQFYDFIGDGGYRLMCSWRTTEGEVDALVADVQDSIEGLA